MTAPTYADLAAELRARAAKARNHAATLAPNDPEAIAARGKARGFDESAAAVSRAERLTRAREAAAAAVRGDGLPCGSHGCPAPAVVALRVRDHTGHVHDCEGHAAALHAGGFIVDEAPLVDGACPWPCSADPIYTADPSAPACQGCRAVAAWLASHPDDKVLRQCHACGKLTGGGS